MKRRVKAEFALNDKEYLDEFIGKLQKNMQVDNNSIEKSTYQAILDSYINKFDPDIYAILQSEGELYSKESDIQSFKQRAYQRILTPDIANTLLDKANYYRNEYKRLCYWLVAVAVILFIGNAGIKSCNASTKNTAVNIKTELQEYAGNFYYPIDSLTEERLVQILKRVQNNGNSYTLDKDNITLHLWNGHFTYQSPEGTYTIFRKWSRLANNNSRFINLEYIKHGSQTKVDLNKEEYNNALQKILHIIEGMRQKDLPK